VQFIVTPAGEPGFSWHYDAEDVFIIQAAGAKSYSLRKNTVHPWPLRETIPINMRYGEEIMPFLNVSLVAGDWLYIPCGYWHRATSPASATAPSISLAIGVMSPSGVHVLDHLRSKLCASIRWRQRLPTVGKATSLSRAELAEEIRECLHQLGADLQSALADPGLVSELMAGAASEQLAPCKFSTYDTPHWQRIG
jgi:50S ribosomal protein L16 3-hydroxylase